jgi:hypothetical protein
MNEGITFGEKHAKETIEYFVKENLDKYFQADQRTSTYSSLYVYNTKDAFVPEMDDLVRLHKLIRERKVFTILEFGVGFSTIVMADAILKNKLDFERLENNKPDIRNTNKFKIFTNDTSEKWIESTKKQLPENLLELIEFKKINAHIDTFNGRLCHFCDDLPSIVPDFIYLDGPYKFDVKGSINGLNVNSVDVTPIAADILLMEPILLPGTFVLIDGRTNNARFLKNNLQREWEYIYDSVGDVSTFELIEQPLGKYNKIQLEYCLNKSYS